jgi:hypothetical protein
VIWLCGGLTMRISACSRACGLMFCSTEPRLASPVCREYSSRSR